MKNWNPLKPGPFGAKADQPGVDPCLVWADATGFADHGAQHHGPYGRVPVLIELQPASVGTPDPLHLLRLELARWKAGQVTDAYPSGKGLRFCTAIISDAYCKAALSGSPTRPGKMIRRFELQLPVVPQRPRPMAVGPTPGAGTPRARGKSTTLIGVIDSGCPFAHLNLRNKAGTRTRLLNIWDQNDRSPAFASPRGRGRFPVDFGYGCEVSRKGLNKIMSSNLVGGVVDEDACYGDSGDLLLRERFQHGGVVLDLLAGPRVLGARREAEPGVPPTWGFANDVASRSDIVFVQMPREAVQDSSSASLGRHLLDGLRYIISCAGPKTRRIVINLSDSTSRGTHDGNSLIEQAMLALIDEQKAQHRELSIVLSAGNSYDEGRHVQFDTLTAGKAAKAVLRLPPGNEAPSHAFVRVPLGAGTLRLRLTPPGSTHAASPWVRAGEAMGLASAFGPTAGIVFPADCGVMSTGMALLTFAPTLVSQEGMGAALAGDWLVEVESTTACLQTVHVYIARNQRNTGAFKRGVQPRFIDIDGRYDPDRAQRNAEVDPPPPFSPMRRLGSLSGLATSAPGAGLWCVAGYRLRDGEPTRYSSAGPAAGGTRIGPDLGAPIDESRGLIGIRAAGGGRSGEVVRAAGTSFGAPQVARVLVNGPPYPTLEQPPATYDPRRSGAGNLPPLP